MSKTGNLEKKRQLGVPFGTASGRLKKSIMLRLLQHLKQDDCFKCKLKIAHPDDLSVEHKVDWLHSSDPVGLFYDLDNIAFSHRKCNRPGRVRQPSDRSKDRLLRCCRCSSYKPTTSFSKFKTSSDGYTRDCLACRNVLKKERRARGLKD